MTFKEYVDGCNKFLAENPDSANYPAVYAKDDEGNGYHQVSTEPSIHVAENTKSYYIEIITLDDSEELSGEMGKVVIIN